MSIQNEITRLSNAKAAISSAILDGGVTVPTGTKLNEMAPLVSQLANMAVSTTFTATIGTTWSGTAAPFSQSITVTGMLATDYPIVDIVPSGTFATAEKQLEAYAAIYRIVPAADKITVYATEKTQTSIPIKLLCIRK